MPLFPALALALVPLAGPSHEPAFTKLLLVDLDDVGYDLLRATPTPVLDWLETNGRFFTNFTTAPVCSPTRAMVNTGAYPSHPDLLFGRNVPLSATVSMPTAPLEPLASIIASAGFTTAKIGKWHLAPVADPTHVLRCGWQSYEGNLGNLNESVPPGNYFSYTRWVDGVPSLSAGSYVTSDESNAAIELIRNGVDFVSLSYHAPHTPVHLPPAHLHSVTPLATDFDQTRAMLAACDTEFGRVLRNAVGFGYTVIVFADNGTAQGIGGQKGTLLEGGVVNPFWAFGPGVTPGRDGTRIGAQDLYDTVAELFGVDASTATRGPQSMSFVRPLRDRTQYRRWAYSERFPNLGVDPRQAGSVWRRTLRTERFKVTRDSPSFGEFMYDLSVDPGETNNLLSSPLGPDAQNAYDQLTLIFSQL